MMAFPVHTSLCDTIFVLHGYCAKTLKSLQQRAMKIIFPAVKDYTLSLIFANVDTLVSRREQPTERFFRQSVLWKSSCLHYLRPDKRDYVITDRLLIQLFCCQNNKPLLLYTFASACRLACRRNFLCSV